MAPPLSQPTLDAPAARGPAAGAAAGHPRWPAADHGGLVLAGFLAVAGSCLTVGAALCLGARLVPGGGGDDGAAGSIAWPAALLGCGRDLLSWGFVPAAAATTAVWRRCRRPMRPALREQLALGAALGLAALTVLLGLDCAVHQQLSAYTLGAGAAAALGTGLLAPVLAFAAWPR